MAGKNYYFETTEDGDFLILKFTAACAHIDETIIQQIRVDLSEVFQNENASHFLIDMSNIEYFSSTFIEVLFDLHRIVSEREGSSNIGLCGMTDYCKQIIEVCKLEMIWNLFDSVEEGKKAFSE